MTKITFYESQGSIRGFVCEDHAGYSEEGSDIVCAAVSALVINTINSITELTESELDVESDEESAYISAFLKNGFDEKAQLLLQSLVLGISSIEEDPETCQFVDLIFEEEL